MENYEKDVGDFIVKEMYLILVIRFRRLSLEEKNKIILKFILYIKFVMSLG